MLTKNASLSARPSWAGRGAPVAPQDAKRLLQTFASGQLSWFERLYLALSGEFSADERSLILRRETETVIATAAAASVPPALQVSNLQCRFPGGPAFSPARLRSRKRPPPSPARFVEEQSFVV